MKFNFIIILFLILIILPISNIYSFETSNVQFRGFKGFGYAIGYYLKMPPKSPIISSRVVEYGLTSQILSKFRVTLFNDLYNV